MWVNLTLRRLESHATTPVSRGMTQQWRRNVSQWDGSSRPTFKSGTARNAFCRPTFWPQTAYCTGGAYSAPPDPLAGLKGAASRQGRGGEGRRRGGEGKGRGGEALAVEPSHFSTGSDATVTQTAFNSKNVAGSAQWRYTLYRVLF